MRTPKLLKKVKEFLATEKGKLREQRKDLKIVLKKLKKKENALKKLLVSEQSEKKREQFRKELAIIFAQRKKGVKKLKSLK